MIDDRHGSLDLRWCRAHLSRFVSFTLVSWFSIGMLSTISVDVIWAWQEFYSEGKGIWQHKLFQDQLRFTLHGGS